MRFDSPFPPARIDLSKLSPLVTPLFSPADGVLRVLEPRILLDASVGMAAVGVADAVDDRADKGEDDRPITAVVERTAQEEQKNKRSRQSPPPADPVAEPPSVAEPEILSRSRRGTSPITLSDPRVNIAAGVEFEAFWGDSYDLGDIRASQDLADGTWLVSFTLSGSVNYRFALADADTEREMRVQTSQSAGIAFSIEGNKLVIRKFGTGLPSRQQAVGAESSVSVSTNIEGRYAEAIQVRGIIFWKRLPTLDTSSIRKVTEKTVDEDEDGLSVTVDTRIQTVSGPDSHSPSGTDILIVSDQASIAADKFLVGLVVDDDDSGEIGLAFKAELEAAGKDGTSNDWVEASLRFANNAKPLLVLLTSIGSDGLTRGEVRSVWLIDSDGNLLEVKIEIRLAVRSPTFADDVLITVPSDPAARIGGSGGEFIVRTDLTALNTYANTQADGELPAILEFALSDFRSGIAPESLNVVARMVTSGGAGDDEYLAVVVEIAAGKLIIRLDKTAAAVLTTIAENGRRKIEFTLSDPRDPSNTEFTVTVTLGLPYKALAVSEQPDVGSTKFFETPPAAGDSVDTHSWRLNNADGQIVVTSGNVEIIKVKLLGKGFTEHNQDASGNPAGDTDSFFDVVTPAVDATADSDGYYIYTIWLEQTLSSGTVKELILKDDTSGDEITLKIEVGSLAAVTFSDPQVNTAAGVSFAGAGRDFSITLPLDLAAGTWLASFTLGGGADYKFQSADPGSDGKRKSDPGNGLVGSIESNRLVLRSSGPISSLLWARLRDGGFRRGKVTFAVEGIGVTWNRFSASFAFLVLPTFGADSIAEPTQSQVQSDLGTSLDPGIKTVSGPDAFSPPGTDILIVSDQASITSTRGSQKMLAVFRVYDENLIELASPEQLRAAGLDPTGNNLFAITLADDDIYEIWLYLRKPAGRTAISITDGGLYSIWLTDSSGNLLEVKIEIRLAPRAVTVADDAELTIPSDLTARRGASGGQFTIATDLAALNAVANAESGGELPFILEFYLEDFRSGVAPQSLKIAVREVTTGDSSDNDYLAVEVVKDIAAGKLRIRLDKNAAAELITIAENGRRKIEFTLTDPRDSTKELTITIIYERPAELGYRALDPADQPAGVYAREVTNSQDRRYNEKYWVVYYDPAAPLNGRKDPLSLFGINVTESAGVISHTDSGDGVIRLLKRGDSGDYLVMLHRLVNRPVEKTVSFTDSDRISLFIKVSIKPIPYFLRQIITSPGFEELPQAPNTPANERTFRAVNAVGRVNVVTATDMAIALIELPNEDFTEDEAADPDNYLSLRSNFRISAIRRGYAVYELSLAKHLSAADGQKTIVIGDGTGFKIKFVFEVRQPLLVPDGRAENPVVTVDAAGKDGSEAKPYGVEAAVDVAAGDLASFTLSGGSNYQIAPDFTALNPDNGNLFGFVIKDGRLVLEKKAGFLTVEGPTAVSVAIRGDGIVDRVVHFSLRLIPLREAEVSDGRVASSGVDLDTSGGKDGSSAAPYAIAVFTDVSVNNLVSFALSGSRGSYNIAKADLAALDANEGYFRFAIKSGRLVLEKITGDPPRASLTPGIPKAISVTIGGDGVEETTFHFTLKVEQLLWLSGGRADGSEVTLDASGDKDGSSGKPVIVVPTDVAVGNLVSFALGGGGNYEIVFSHLLALDNDNEKYFQFAIESGRLVLKRIEGSPVKATLDADPARTISVVVRDDRIGVRLVTFRFTLEVKEKENAPPPSEVAVSGGRADGSGVTLEATGRFRVPYAAKVPTDVAVGDVVSFTLSGSSSYRIVSSQLRPLADSNEGYFRFAIENDRLVLKRIAGNPAKSALDVDSARTISAVISGERIGNRLAFLRLSVEIVPLLELSGGRAENPVVTVDAAGKDGSEAKPYGVEAAVDVAAGDLASFTLSGGSNYQIVPDFTALNPDNRNLFGFVIKDGRLVLEKKAGFLTVEGPTAVSVVIRGDGIADRVVHFSLRLIPLREAEVSDGRVASSGVDLDTSGGKDGSSDAPYAIAVFADVSVNNLVSFALSGSRGSYNIAKADLAALDANEGYFRFVIKGGRLVLERITGDPPRASLAPEIPKAISVTIGGDGVEETTFHFTLKVVPLLELSGGRAENPVVTVDAAGKDGSQAKPYGVEAAVDVAAGDLVSFTLSGGSNYQIVPDFTALNPDNRNLFGFVIKDGRLVLEKKAGFLTVEGPTAVSVAIRGDGIADRVVHFSLRLIPLREVEVSNGRVASSGVDLDTSGGKDGSSDAPYVIAVFVDVSVNNLVSFALSGSRGSYNIAKADLAALDANEGYFRFAIKGGRLVLERIAGSPTKDRLTADTARAITVTIGGDGVEETTFHFTLKVEQLPPVVFLGGRADDSEVTLDASGGKDGSEAAKAYGVKVKVDVDVGSLVSFDLGGGGSDYEVVSSDLTALHDDNEGYFQFTVENKKLVLKRIAGSSPKAKLTADTARTITVTVGGDGVEDTTFHFTLEVEQLPAVTVSGERVASSGVDLDTGGGKDGSSDAPYAIAVFADVSVNNLVSFALSGSRGSYNIAKADLAALDANEGYFRFVIKGGRLVLERITGDPPRASLTPEIPKAISVTIGGDGVEETTFHFTLKVEQLLWLSGGRADDSEVTLDTSGGKDGSSGKPIIVVPTDVAVGNLVSFALGGGGNYGIVFSHLLALADGNEGYFQFAIESGRLVLKRIEGSPVKATLDADPARTISVVVRDDRIGGRLVLFRFILEVKEKAPPPSELAVTDGRADGSGVTLEATGSSRVPYAVKVPTNVAVGDVVSFTLSGSSGYRIVSFQLSPLADGNERYFRFAIENDRLVLKRIAGSPAKSALDVDSARTISAVISGERIGGRLVFLRLSVEIVEPSVVEPPVVEPPVVEPSPSVPNEVPFIGGVVAPTVRRGIEPTQVDSKIGVEGIYKDDGGVDTMVVSSEGESIAAGKIIAVLTINDERGHTHPVQLDAVRVNPSVTLVLEQLPGTTDRYILYSSDEITENIVGEIVVKDQGGVDDPTIKRSTVKLEIRLTPAVEHGVDIGGGPLVRPVDPGVEPVDPGVEPVDPEESGVEPGVDPSVDPGVEPVDPEESGVEPVDPEEPGVEPVDPEEPGVEPVDPEEPDNAIFTAIWHPPEAVVSNASPPAATPAVEEGVALRIGTAATAPKTSPPCAAPPPDMAAVDVLNPWVVAEDDAALTIGFASSHAILSVDSEDLPAGVVFDSIAVQFRVNKVVYEGEPVVVAVRVRCSEDDDDEFAAGSAVWRSLRIDLAPLIEQAQAIRQEPDGGGKPDKVPDGDGAISDAGGRAASGRAAGGQDDVDGAETNGVASSITNGITNGAGANGDVVGNVANGIPPNGVADGVADDGTNGNGHANDWQGFTAKLERASQDFGGELDALMAQLRKLDKGQNA